eukprot:TRINITY_DN64637_c0_g1_i1.p1 TRINITY_DN64637_c0_g1~~TRINITY_DN64637_c0_g1_i1.p1  ORF type:complete len:885 (-),score=115.90 TRINITY_DN64637_c0_g1_i1:122-2776(-)
MSTDPAALIALAQRTKAVLRYFELVTLRFSGGQQQCYLCVGLHAIFLVRRNLTALYPNDKGGEIYYAYIEEVIEDTQTNTDLLIQLGDNRPDEWQSDKLYVICEHRCRLIDFLRVTWQADHVWRFGRGKSFEHSRKPLRSGAPKQLLEAKPPKGYTVIKHQGYSFFARQGYELQQQSGCGLAVLIDEARGLELRLEVLDPVPLEELEALGRDHIRWVASEYQERAADGLQYVSLPQSTFHSKRMNLTNDIASWSCWSLLIRAEQHRSAAVLLRRQYVPPLLDCSQDIAITIKHISPYDDANTWSKFMTGEPTRYEEALLAEAKYMADTCGPLVPSCVNYQTLYRDMIQAKLDALLFSEDAMRWLASTLDLRPKHETEAKKFLKAILTLLQDESAMNAEDHIFALQIVGDSEEVESPMLIPKRMVQSAVLLDADSAPEQNTWRSRVARYLAYCVDGGLLGNRVTLAELTAVELEMLTEDSQIELVELLTFMLHIRPRDMKQTFFSMRVQGYVDAENFEDYTFNERVMQSLIELGWVAKMLSPTAGAGELGSDYALFLNRILTTPIASVSLKASACREIMKVKHIQPHLLTLVPALVNVLSDSSSYLKTYATATVVNISGVAEVAKNMLVTTDNIAIFRSHLRSTDDALLHYTLVLLTMLSKTAHHRTRLHECGISSTLVDLISYYSSRDCKPHILAEMCSVIGQLCNDEAIWTSICGSGDVMTCFLRIFDAASPRTVLQSKVMFTLRQLCGHINASDGKVVVAPRVIPGVTRALKDLAMQANLSADDLDCVANALLLFITLSISQVGAALMLKNGMLEVMQELHGGHVGSIESLEMRLDQLDVRLAQARKKLGDLSMYDAPVSRHATKSGGSREQSKARADSKFA